MKLEEEQATTAILGDCRIKGRLIAGSSHVGHHLQVSGMRLGSSVQYVVKSYGEAGLSKLKSILKYCSDNDKGG
jgi:hypothetical protein